MVVGFVCKEVCVKCFRVGTGNTSLAGGVPFVNDVIPLLGRWSLGLLGRFLRDVCQGKVSINVSLILVRWGRVCIGAGLIIVAMFGELAFVLFCRGCSSDDA